jgi:L-methionine (R)-S-oxide reductase
MTFAASPLDAATPKPALYAHLTEQLSGLLEGERDPIANAANTAALIYLTLPGLNWAGGAAAERRRSILVADVHAFPGHIACDAASRAELVVPLLDGDRLRGVLDLDSPLPGRFDAEDQAGLERIAALYVNRSDHLAIAPR